jgi:hypothetical protein
LDAAKPKIYRTVLDLQPRRGSERKEEEIVVEEIVHQHQMRKKTAELKANLKRKSQKIRKKEERPGLLYPVFFFKFFQVLLTFLQLLFTSLHFLRLMIEYYWN